MCMSTKNKMDMQSVHVVLFYYICAAINLGVSWTNFGKEYCVSTCCNLLTG